MSEQKNNDQHEEWRKEYTRVTGKEAARRFSCRVCHFPFFTKEKINPIDAVCSDECHDELNELRLEKHWS